MVSKSVKQSYDLILKTNVFVTFIMLDFSGNYGYYWLLLEHVHGHQYFHCTFHYSRGKFESNRPFRRSSLVSSHPDYEVSGKLELRFCTSSLVCDLRLIYTLSRIEWVTFYRGKCILVKIVGHCIILNLWLTFFKPLRLFKGPHCHTNSRVYHFVNCDLF